MKMKYRKHRIELVKEENAVEYEATVLRSPVFCYEEIEKLFRLSRQTEEVTVMLALNMKSEIIGAFEVSRGGLASATLSPREVYKRALLTNAAAIIIAHNHPSGSLTPSIEDKAITLKLKECGDILGVRLIDHLIISDAGYISLREEGEM